MIPAPLTTPPPHNSEHLTHPKYRADIDGLRAIAILSVVGFHAFPLWVKGGFIGVDIFFVISGYLISTIIFDGLERNNFSFVEFYSRRIKRIFPALLLVLIACFAFGWFPLLADEYKQLGKHIAGGAGFVSNYLFWNESGYFDNAAEKKPLLHLWSLGIEEQFYIIWPLLLWFSWKQRLNLLTITIVVGVISFAANLQKVSSDVVEAFYSPQTRFWELLIGSLLAYITLYKKSNFSKFTHRLDMGFDAWLGFIVYAQAPEGDGNTRRNMQSLLGAVLIAIGVLVITKETRFPGWWALLPTLGAVLIISAGKQAWLNRAVLSTRVLVWFGLISFPLYLWHWPLLSFARIMESETPSLEIRIAAVLIAIVLAWLTYWLIEKPIRFGKHSKEKTITLLVLMVAVGYVGYNSYKRDGLPFRAFPKQIQAYTKSIAVTDRVKECSDISHAYEKSADWFCKLGEQTSQPSIFAYGDSHALSLIPAIEKFGIENKINILLASSSGCPPILGIQSMRGVAWTDRYNCQKLNDRIFEYVKSNRNIKSILLIARWTYYTGGTTKPFEINPLSTDGATDFSVDVKLEKKIISSRVSFDYGIQLTIEKYRNIGVRIIFFEDNPLQLYDPKDALRKSWRTDASINRLSVTTKEHKNNQSWISSRFKNISSEMATIVNFDKLLCKSDICPLVDEGKFLYSDDDHLSVDGAMLVYPNLMEALSTPLHDTSFRH